MTTAGPATRLYGWDTSHYDGEITPAIARDARNQGISLATHKLGQGTSNTDTTAGRALAAFRDAGIPVLGGYYFLDPAASAEVEALRCIDLADRLAPWWREFPAWFWQCDAETSTSGRPSFDKIKTFCDTLAAETHRTVLVYASAGQYGNSLVGIGHPLWNANYGRNPVGHFRSIYPGDNSRGWGRYSGQTPVLLQYGSNATIAGRTTCDANAFRGTLDDLYALIGVTMALTPGEIAAVAAAAAEATVTRLLAANLGASGPNVATALQRASSGAVEVAAEHAELDAVAAALAGLPAAVVAALPEAGAGGPLTVEQVEAAVHVELGKIGITVAP